MPCRRSQLPMLWVFFPLNLVGFNKKALRNKYASHAQSGNQSWKHTLGLNKSPPGRASALGPNGGLKQRRHQHQTWNHPTPSQRNYYTSGLWDLTDLVTGNDTAAKLTVSIYKHFLLLWEKIPGAHWFYSQIQSTSYTISKEMGMTPPFCSRKNHFQVFP